MAASVHYPNSISDCFSRPPTTPDRAVQCQVTSCHQMSQARASRLLVSDSEMTLTYKDQDGKQCGDGVLEEDKGNLCRSYYCRYLPLEAYTQGQGTDKYPAKYEAGYQVTDHQGFETSNHKSSSGTDPKFPIRTIQYVTVMA